MEGENKITQGVIWKQILVFFFPILLGTFFQQLYNTADAMIVGNFVGKSALAAVGGGTGTIVNLLVGFFVGVSAGSTVIISQYFGAGKRRETSQAVHTSIALGIVGGAVLMVLGLVFSPMILGLMDTPDEVMGSAVTYISIYFGGMIFNLLYNMGAGILRAIGDFKRPLYYLMVCTIVNIVLDLMFVAVFNMGVAGAGIATVMSQVISALLVLRRLIKTNECYKLNVKEIKFTGFILKNIIAIGLPTGLQSVMYNLSNIFLQAAVNSLGVNVMAAWSAYQKIDGLFWMIMTAFGTAVTTFAGQNFGAGRYDRVRGSVRACLIMSFITSAILSSILMLLSGTAFKLFSNEAEVVAEGVSMMRSLCRFTLPMYVWKYYPGLCAVGGITCSDDSHCLGSVRSQNCLGSDNDARLEQYAHYYIQLCTVMVCDVCDVYRILSPRRVAAPSDTPGGERPPGRCGKNGKR